jgi:aquaporin Z
MGAAFTLELILTFMFLMILLSAIDRAPAGLAPIPIGLGLVLVHLIGLPVTNVSVNPARSAGPAIIVGNEALQQLWLFWVAPLAGALVAGVTYPALAATSERGGQSTVAIRGSTAHGES